jgi:N-glycosylase/DNA lyase
MELAQPVSLNLTVESHGWYQLSPWRWGGNLLERTSMIGGEKEWVRIQQPHLQRLDIETSSANTDIVSERVTRWLNLDWDPSEFLGLCDINDPSISSLVRMGGGRFLRGDTFFEDLIKTVCTINTTWKQTNGMVASIVCLGNEVFPAPTTVQEIGPERLSAECKLGFRARTVANITDQMLSDDVIRSDGSARFGLITFDYLTSLKGIGPYAAAHTMMLLRDFSTLPVDSEVSAYLRLRGIDPKNAQSEFSHWGDYRFLGYKLRRIVERSNWTGE